MNTQHTPGPWYYDMAINNVAAAIVDADGYRVMDLIVTHNTTAQSSLTANARLIAAAPDMLQALMLIANYDPTQWDACTLANIARAAIARATGQQE